MDELDYLNREAESDFPEQEECCDNCGSLLSEDELADGCEWCTECNAKYEAIQNGVKF